MADYLLPDVGEGLTEAEIVAWRVKVGDVIEINDVVVDIETAKSIVELPSPYAGTVTALLVAEGETVEVGTAIISVGDPSPVDAPAAPAGAPVPDEAPAPEMEIDLSNPAASGGGEGESLVGRSKAERGPQRRPRKGSASPSTVSAAATQMQVQGAFAPGGAQSDPVVESDEPAVPAHEVAPPPAPPEAFVPEPARTGQQVRALAKPPVRKLAKDLGVDLASVRASGPGGVVTRADVEQHAGSGAVAAAAAPVATAAPAQTGGETRVPVKGVRKVTAQAMVASAFTAPHVTEWLTLDVTRTVELVDRLKADRGFADVKVSPLLVVAKAVCLAVRRTPELNATWDEAAQEIVLKHDVNLGIAAATPRGLLVPNVKGAQAMDLHALASALGELVATAREGRTQPAEQAGGTFTITNVGVFGVDAGTPILNPGETGILAVGAVKRMPWVVQDAAGERIEPRSVCTLALSFDHRVVDGEQGSRFLADVGRILSDPAAALLF